MLEKEVEIDSKGCKLSGTLCLPEQNGVFLAVLTIHGSGPLDRDENIKGQKLNVFNTLAHYLAEKGIASLRYDKRGCGRSTGDYYTAGYYDLLEDAIACFRYLESSEYCDIAPQHPMV